MGIQIKQSFRIEKPVGGNFKAEIYKEEDLQGILYRKTYQEARLAAIQYLKDHQ